MITVRPLNQSDTSNELFNQIGELRKQSSANHRVNYEVYAQAIIRDSTVVLGAWDNERVVGLCVLNEVHTLRNSIGDIDDVVVDKAYRGQGISKLLLDSVVAESRRRGLEMLRLTSAPERIVANKLYVSYGFQLHETNSYRLSI